MSRGHEPSSTPDQIGRGLWRHVGDRIAIVFYLILPLLFFWQILRDPALIVREDAASYYQPYYTFVNAELWAGRWPLWNPFSVLGIPYYAGLQSSLFYPLRWPLFFMPYLAGHLLLVWSHYFLTAVAGHLLLRVALRVGPLAAFLGAVSITYCAFAQGHLPHLSYVMAYPWFLICFLAVWLAMQQRPWLWMTVAGGCIGLLALIGTVHLILLLIVLLGAFVAYHTICAAVLWIRRRDSGGWAVLRPGAVVAGAFTLGVLIGAVQLLPAVALSKGSAREDMRWEFLTAGNAHPVHNSIQMVAPFFFGNHRVGYWGELPRSYHGIAHYSGALVVLMAIVGVLSLGRDRFLWFLVVLAAAGFVVGAGKYLPLYRLLYDWSVPGFSTLRNPTRIYWCTEIALACLAAVGVDRTFGGRMTWRRRWLPAASAAAGGVVVLGVLAWAIYQLYAHADDPRPLVRWVHPISESSGRFLWLLETARRSIRQICQEHDLAAWFSVVIIAFTSVATPLLLWRRKSAGRMVAGGLGLLLVADLFAISFGSVQYDDQYVALKETPPAARWLQEHLGLQRYLLFYADQTGTAPNDIGRNRSMQFRLRSVEGVGGGILDSPARQRFITLIRRSPKLMRLAGVRYVLAESPIQHPGLRFIQQEGPWNYYELDSLHMAYFVRRVIGVADSQQVLGALVNAQFNPREMAVVVAAPPQATARSSATKLDVNHIDSVPGRWTIDVETDAAAQLVVLEGYARDWRCRVNGQPTPVLETNGQFMSVAVPAGASRVVLKYAPTSFRNGAIVSIVGLAVAAGVLLAERRSRRRGRAGDLSKPAAA